MTEQDINMILNSPPDALQAEVNNESNTSSGENSPDILDKKETEDIFALDDWANTVGYISDNDFDMIDMLSAALDQVTNQLEDKQKEFVVKSTEWTQKTREKIKAQTKKLEDQRT